MSAQRSTNAYPTPQHKESANRDHPDDRHDFFSAGLLHDLDPIDDALRQQLVKNPEMLVVINADDGVEHGQVVEVMDIARAANVAKMAIAVKPKEQKR